MGEFTQMFLHAGPSVLAAFTASLVEFVEALTVILAVGSVAGWRRAISGAAAAIVLLVSILAVFGRVLTSLPLAAIQIGIGSLLLLFGMRWLSKAILRVAGVLPLNNEAAAFAKEAAAARMRLGSAWQHAGFGSSFQITMLEGTEVIFIVIAVGAAGRGLLLPASLGALAALLLVVLLGLLIHRPLSRVPQNPLKFLVGILLSAFGSFWAGEGFGISWPGGDFSIMALAAGFLAAAIVAVFICRTQASLATDRRA